MSLQMTRSERETFLAGVHVGVISIDDPGRAPLSAPIWYDFDPEAGLWVLTGRSSRKGVALDKAMRFSLVAQTEDMPYKYVSVEGAVVDVYLADTEKHSRPMARRYLGKEFGDAYTDSTADEVSHVYTMRPERWLTVDYGKLQPGS